jgi:hypothetical protein
VTQIGTTLNQNGTTIVLKSTKLVKGNHSFCRNDRSQLIPSKGMVAKIQKGTQSDPKVTQIGTTIDKLAQRKSFLLTE